MSATTPRSPIEGLYTASVSDILAGDYDLKLEVAESILDGLGERGTLVAEEIREVLELLAKTRELVDSLLAPIRPVLRTIEFNATPEYPPAKLDEALDAYYMKVMYTENG